MIEISPMAHLVVREPGLVPVSIPLQGELHVGRHEQNELSVSDHRVSRRHARFALSEQGWTVSDLGSTHGTAVNGVRVQQHVLRDGDQIQIGNVLLVYSTGDELGAIVHKQRTAQDPDEPPSADTADRRLALIYEVSRALRALGDTDELLGRMLDAIVDVFECERALFGLGSLESNGLRRIERRRGGAKQDDIILSRSTLEAMLVQREAILLGAASAPRKARREEGTSAMGAPLAVGTRVLGFVYIDDRRRPGRFTPTDLDYLTAIAHLTAAALENAEHYRQAIATARGPSAAQNILGESAPIQRLRSQIAKYAAASMHVLIRGESGTGKELVARGLHAASPRAARPFVAVNCAAIPDTMIEDELFGHVKGAFTGALRDRRGSFELASSGTLFLDEIGDLSPSAQAKLLRAIQEGEVQPLGTERSVRVDVRIVSATHKDLMQEVAAGRFREDLYYRLAVLEIEAPPLRERGEDIALLARALLQAATAGMGKRIAGFTDEALEALRGYRWPGNVRELKNEVERAAINAESSWIGAADLGPRVAAAGREREPRSMAPAQPLAEQFASLEAMERALVEEAVKASGRNLSEAARLLGISRVMLKRRVHRFGI
jgi:Nif-specific regulatory protein